MAGHTGGMFALIFWRSSPGGVAEVARVKDGPCKIDEYDGAFGLRASVELIPEGWRLYFDPRAEDYPREYEVKLTGEVTCR